MTSKHPELLFLSPVLPTLSSSGGALMRAGLQLKALAANYSIHLEVVTRDPNLTIDNIPEEIRQLCKSYNLISIAQFRWTYLRLLRAIPFEQVRILLRALYPWPLEFSEYPSFLKKKLSERYANKHIYAIHIFKLLMAPTATYIIKKLQHKPKLTVLDLDDFESKMLRRYALSHRNQAGYQFDLLRRLDAIKYKRMESFYTHFFKLSLVCSKQDQQEMCDKFGISTIRVLPNGIDLPKEPSKSLRPPKDVVKLLFVGSMNYYPNQDAIFYLWQEILPILRLQSKLPFKITIVGREPAQWIIDLATEKEIEVTANPPVVEPYYHDADIAIVPIRIGGGTRIKILEAFSYRRPVISTHIGAEGLEVRDGENILLADTAEEFANACLELMHNYARALNIAENGYKLVAEKYSLPIIQQQLQAIYAELDQSKTI